jgi:vacuolar-type H+-ATPase subunit E/Vma4
MSQEAILAGIEVACEVELARVQQETESQVELLREEARKAGEVKQAEAYKAALRPHLAECTRCLSQANLQARQLLDQAREAIVCQILAEVQQRLTGLRDEPIYGAVLLRLTEEAIRVSGRSRPRLIADPRDESILEPVLSALNLAGDVTYHLSTWGGIVTQSEDSQIVVNNTLESRLEQAIPYIRRELATLLKL